MGWECTGKIVKTNLQRIKQGVESKTWEGLSAGAQRTGGVCIRNQKEGVLCKAQFSDPVVYGFVAKRRCPGLAGISCPILEIPGIERNQDAPLESPLSWG